MKKCDETRPFCFVSYSSKNKEYVFDVVENLFDDGFNIWIDPELENHVGREWREIVFKTLLNENCQCVLWFVSKDSIASKNVAEELVFASKEETTIKHGNKKMGIYPVEIEKITPASDIMSYCSNIIKSLEEQGELESATAAKTIKSLINNDIKRLSIDKIFTKEGRAALAESMRNGGFGDIVDHPFLKVYEGYYNNFQKDTKSSGRGHLFGDVEEELLPYVKSANGGGPLIREIDKLFSDEGSDSNCLLLGRGGSGKTVAMLYLMQYLYERKIAAFYVPLYELGNELSATDYILRQIEQRRNMYSAELDSFLSSKKVVFLLDGLNEIQPEHEQFIRDKINLLMNKGVRIIITSRDDRLQHKYRFLLENFVKMEISPIPADVVSAYLRKYGHDEVQNESLLEILSSPLMLKLYNLQQGNSAGSFYTLENLWKKDNNAGSLIWNFLLTECKKTWEMSGREDDTNLFAFLYIAPYIAWNMVDANKMSLSISDFNRFVREARALYTHAYESGSSIFENIPYYSDIDEKKRPEDILKEAGLIIENQNTVSFYHQTFRDCLAAVQCLNGIKLNPDGDCSGLSSHVLPDEILKFIYEVDDAECIDGYWRSIDVNFLPDRGSLTRLNLIKLFNLKYGGLSWVDFSGKDLRDISLSGYSFVSEEAAASFCGANISEYTFAPPAVNNAYINCLAVSEDFHYVITGSAIGEIIVFDIENSCPVGSKKMPYGDSPEMIKSLDLIAGNLWVCFENGEIFIYSFNYGELELISKHAQPVPGCKVTAVAVSANKYFVSLDGGAVCYACISGDLSAVNFQELVTFNQGAVKRMVTYRSDLLFCGMSSGEIVRINTLSNKITATWAGHGEEVTDLAVKDGFLFSSSMDRTVVKRNINSGIPEPAERWNRGAGKQVNRILASDGCPYVFTCSSDGNLLKLDAATGALKCAFKFSATQGIIHHAAFSKDKKFIIVDGPDNAPIIYGIEGTGKIYRDFKSVTSGAMVVINVSENGKYALAQSIKGSGIECIIWDVDRGVPTYVPIYIPSLWGKAKAITNDSKTAYLGLGEHVEFFQFGERSVVDKKSSKNLYKGWLYGITFDEEKGIAWLGTDYKKIYKFDLRKFTLLSEPVFTGNDTINCFARSKFSDVLYFGDWGGGVSKLDIETNNKLLDFKLENYHDWINDLCLTDDESCLFGALDNGYIIKWDANTGEILDGHWHYSGKERWDKPGINALTIESEDGNLIALTNDFCVFILKQGNFEEVSCVYLNELASGAGAIRSATLIKGTTRVLLGTDNGDMYLYDVKTGEKIRRYRRIKNTCLVGCDFAGAVLPEGSDIVESLTDSGAMV